MDFQEAVGLILELEGGGRIVSHPRDPGGLTKYGISLRAHPELGPDGIRNLTEEHAIGIYRTRYWTPLRLGRFSPRLSLPLFDAAVNHGIRAAGELLQKALNCYHYSCNPVSCRSFVSGVGENQTSSVRRKWI